MPQIKELKIYGPFTTTERDAFSAGGTLDTYTIILNSTTGGYEFWNGSTWLSLANAGQATIQLLTTGSITDTSGADGDISINSSLSLDGFILGNQASDKAAANDLDIWTAAASGDRGNTLRITGSTQINAMKITTFSGSDIAGAVINLIFTGSPTVKHNTAGGAGYFSFLLDGAVDFVAAAGDRLTVVFIDSTWQELSRSRVTAYSGTYTPTLTNVANLTASTAYQCQWLRVGNIVTVSGKVDVDPTLTATATQLGISLPVASNFGAAEDCGGTAFASGIAGMGAAILGDAANNRAEMNWVATDVTNQPLYMIFQFEVI